MSGRLLTIVWDRAAEREARLQKVAELLRGLSERERQEEFAYQNDDPACGRTALHAAAGQTWPAMIALLLKHGCLPDVRDRKGATALAAVVAEAAWAADEDVRDIMQLLCRHGASIEAADADGYRPLAYAANWAGDKGQGQRGQEAMVAVKFLLDRGAAIDAVNSDGATALMIAVDEGYEAVAQLLLERGASLTVADWEGHTALFYALLRTDQPREGSKLAAHELAAQEQRRLRLVALLLNAAEQLLRGGAAQLANMQAANGWSALHLAAHNNLLKAAQLLLDHGADTRLLDEDGLTAEALARSRRLKKMVALLQQRTQRPPEQQQQQQQPPEQQQQQQQPGPSSASRKRPRHGNSQQSTEQGGGPLAAGPEPAGRRGRSHQQPEAPQELSTPEPAQQQQRQRRLSPQAPQRSPTAAQPPLADAAAQPRLQQQQAQRQREDGTLPVLRHAAAVASEAATTPGPAQQQQQQQQQAAPASLAERLAARAQQAAQHRLNDALRAFEASHEQRPETWKQPLALLVLAGKGGQTLQDVVGQWAGLPRKRQQLLFEAALLQAAQGNWGGRARAAAGNGVAA